MSTIPLLQLSAVALLALALTGAGAASAGDVAVVVRPDTPVDDLSFADARKIFVGDRQFWTSSLRVTLLMRAPPSREREVMLKKVYGMTEAQFRQYWISKIFRLEASAGPKIVYSADMAVELVAAIPGAVAFVDSAEAPKALKVLKIDGHLPGEREYRLR